jgi:hypothetical protein
MQNSRERNRKTEDHPGRQVDLLDRFLRQPGKHGAGKLLIRPLRPLADGAAALVAADAVVEDERLGARCRDAEAEAVELVVEQDDVAARGRLGRLDRPLSYAGVHGAPRFPCIQMYPPCIHAA